MHKLISHRFKRLAFVCLLIFVITLASLHPIIAAAQTQSGDNTEATLDALLRRYASKRDLTDWEAIVLGVNGVDIKTPLFATPYFKRLEKDIAEKKGIFRLVTDYARIVIVYRSHGKDAANIVGYDFYKKIIDFPNKGNQGLNAYCWSLIALYGQEPGVTQPLIDQILAYQISSGGFSSKPLSRANPNVPTTPDIDLTAMALTALAPYASDKTIQNALDKALSFLSIVQEADGSYKANGVNNAESVAQVVIALCAYGIDPNDARFVKQNHSLWDALALFSDKKTGAYTHVIGGKTDPIATRQVALALSAYRRFLDCQSMAETEKRLTKGIFEL